MHIVFNIGCIECGVSSKVVGCFDDFDKAKCVADRLNKTMDWRDGGQNEYEVFDVPPIGFIDPEYIDALEV